MSKARPRLFKRGQSWVVDFGRQRRPDGTVYRERRTFATRAEAQEELTARGFESKNRRVRLLDMTDEERQDVLRAKDLLKGREVSLEDAVMFYLKHGAPASGPRELTTVFDEYIAAKERAGRRPRTIQDARAKAGRFVREVGKQYAHEVMTEDVERWLNGLDASPATWNGYRVAVKTLFAYCVRRGYIATNPAIPIEPVHLDEAAPEILDLTTVRRLLNTAERECPKLVPHLAIGFFAGLRSSELEGLRWESVNLKDGLITVTAATAKKRRQRHVELSANLLAWLTPYWEPSGPVHSSRRHIRAVREAAEVEWPHNAMRHTCASFHLAMHEDAPRTSLLLGHRSPDVLFSAYRNIRTVTGVNVTKALAAKYWSIQPRKDTDNVIPLATGS